MTLPSAGSEISQVVVADALKDRDIVLRTEQSVQAIDGGRFDGLSASWLVGPEEGVLQLSGVLPTECSCVLGPDQVPGLFLDSLHRIHHHAGASHQSRW